MSEPRSIVHINTHDVAGGAAKVAARLAEAQRAMGYRAEMLVGYRRGRSEPATAFTPSPDPLLMGRCRRSGWLDYEFQGSHGLYEHPLVRGADVLHFHNLHGEYFNPFSIPGLSVMTPTVWTLHDMQAITGHCAHAFTCTQWQAGCRHCPSLDAEPRIAEDTAPALLANRALVYRHAVLWVVAPSRWLKDKVDQSILHEQPCAVIPNGIDTSLFVPADGRRARERFGIPTDRFVIGAVGNGGPMANPWKGGGYTRQALSAFWERYPEAVFVNIGGMAKDTDPRIISVPAIRDEARLAELYSALDVFLYTPIADNCPLVVIEAMACGRPLVTFAVGGIPELVQDGRTGQLVPFGDAGALANALVAFHDDPARCSAMGQAAREHAVRHLDHGVVAGRYQALYETAVAEHEQRRRCMPALTVPAVPEMIRTPAFLALCAAAWPQKTAGAGSPPPYPKGGAENVAGDPGPLISIVTPSFNQGRFLEACLDSVLSQGYPRLEYVVMDGGSDDGSVDIIKKYERHLAHWQSRPDGGHYAALTDGFARTRGPVMAWINSDDILHPGALAAAAQVFANRPNVHWITGRPNIIDEHGRQIWQMPTLPLWHRGKYLGKHYKHPYIQQEGTFFRRSLWEVAGARLHPRLALAGDLELWMRFFRHAPLHSVDALLGAFRKHDAQKTHALLADYDREAEAVLDAEIARWQSEGAPAPPAAPLPISRFEIAGRKASADEAPAAPSLPEAAAVTALGDLFRVSAIVSTYDAERFLPGCLDSLLAQTIAGQMEIIVIDSASPGNERAVVERYRGRHGNIRYLRTEARENVYTAWNRAVAMARGTYLINANTDDRLRPDACECMARVLDQVADAGAVYADSLITTGENETFADHSAMRLFARPGFSLRQLLVFNYFGPHPMWRRRVHESIGDFDAGYTVAGDYDFFLRLAVAFGAVHLNDTLGIYQERPGSIEHRRRRQCAEEVRRIQRRFRRETPLDKIFPGVERDPAAAAEGFTDLGNGCLYGDLPDPESALWCYERAIDTGAAGAATVANLGVALAVSGMPAEGLRFLEKAAADRPDAVPSLEQLKAHLAASGGSAADVRAFAPVDVTHPVVLAARRGRRVVVSAGQVTAVAAGGALWEGVEMIRSVSWAWLGQGAGGAATAPPVVSVVIPTHDRPRMLTAAIGSVLAQSYPHFEILVVDDAGSLPADGRVAAFHDPRIRLIRHGANRGLAAARNTGIAAARGRYIALLDDDDLFYPNHLSTVMAALAAGHSVVYTDAVRASLAPDGGGGYRLLEKRVPYCMDFDRDSLLIGNIAPVNCFVFERRLAVEAGLFDTAMTTLEDWDFWIRLSRRVDFHHIPKNTVQVNWCTDGTTMTSSRARDFRRNRQRITAANAPAIAAIADRQRILSTFAAVWKADGRGAFRPLTSIIVLTLNQLHLTRQCVQSVLAHTRSAVELIIVDNGSTDETIAYANALTLCPSAAVNIRVIANAENRGYAAGNNQGMAVARGDFIVLLNNDTVVTPGWLEPLLRLARSRPEIGVVGPVSNQVAGPQRLMTVGYDTGTLEGLDAFGIQIAKQSASARRAGRVVGFCMMFSRAVMSRIGALDERFGTGNFEDDDYCLRAALAGFQSWIARDSFVHHAGGATFAAQDNDRRRRLEENWRIFKKKWNLAENLPYGTYEIGDILQRGFDPALHWEPLASAEPGGEGAGNRKAVTPMFELNQNAAMQCPGTFRAAAGDGPSGLDSAMAHLSRGDTVAAVDALTKALDRSPDDKDLLKALAEVYYSRQQRIEDALRLYVQVLALDPFDVDALMMTGHICVSLEKIADAAHFYNRVLEAEPWHGEARRFMDAIARHQAGQAAGEASADDRYREATALAEAGDLDGAVKTLERLVADHPGHGQAHNDLGVLYYRGGDMEKALRCYERAAAIAPPETTFQKNLADFYYVAQGRVAEALEIYVKILSLEPGDVETLMTAGHICVSLERFAEARQYYERVLTVEPRHTEAGRYLAALLRHTAAADAAALDQSPEARYAAAQQLADGGDTAGALSALNALAADYPGQAPVHNDLGVLHHRGGELEKAERHYDHAVFLDPGNTVFRKNLADFYAVALNRHEAALTLFVEILAADPHDVEALMGTGHVCRVLGRSDDAAHFFERVLESEPWNAEARRCLEDLRQPAVAAGG